MANPGWGSTKVIKSCALIPAPSRFASALPKKGNEAASEGIQIVMIDSLVTELVWMRNGIAALVAAVP